MLDTVFRSDRALLPEGLRPAAIGVRDGRIAAVDGPDALEGETVVDVGDRLLLPGLVDTHVHFNDPGRADWEGFPHGTAAALAGGVTAIVDMPLNSSPVTVSIDALRAKAAAAAAGSRADYGLWAGLVPGNAPLLPGLLEAGALGVKCFLCPSGLDDFPAARAEDLEAAAPLLAERGAPLLVHAEDPETLAAAWKRSDPDGAPRSFARFLASRPPAAETVAVARLIDLARRTGCRIHVVHVAAAECVSLLAAARAASVPIGGETCPHYLVLDAERVPDGDPRFKCAPPIRERRHAEALWSALEAGHLQLIASDHSPCPPGMRAPESGSFSEAWGGIAGVQLGLRLVWTEAARRGIGIDRVVDWMSRAPAQLAGIDDRKGALESGRDADLVVFDPDARTRVRGDELLQRHPVTPYEGIELRGRVVTTYLRGRCVYDRGATVGAPRGRPLLESP